MKSLTIDIGGTSSKCIILDNDKKIINYSVFTNNEPFKLVENIYKTTMEELVKINIDISEIEFISVAVAGIVNKNMDIVLMAPNLNWWDYPIKDEFLKFFKNKKLVVMNDARAALYGEWSITYQKKPKSVFMYTIGTGIGGSAIVNGEVISGDNLGFASEPGHGGGFAGDVKCNCGLTGCIDIYSSATGITKGLNDFAKNSNGSLNKFYSENKKDFTIKDISHLFLSDDKEVLNIFKKHLEPLAKHMSVIVHTFDFELIIIGGGVSALGQKLIDLIESLLDKWLLNNFKGQTKIKMAKLNNDAGALGSFEWANQNQEKEKNV